MTDVSRRSAVAHELRQGEQALGAARLLRDQGFLDDALSRLYYALYHHAVALLLTEGIEPRRHAALPGLLGQHILPRGDLTAGDIAVVGRTASCRELADYERTWSADQATTDATFGEVEPLVARIRSVLVRDGWVA